MTQEKQKTKKAEKAEKPKNTIITEANHKYVVFYEGKKFGFEFAPQATLDEIKDCVAFLLEQIENVIAENKEKSEAAAKAEAHADAEVGLVK